MEKLERETHDFLNVQSFSQLPFIRPQPSQPSSKEKGALRLFGKDFSGGDSVSTTVLDESESIETNMFEDANQVNSNSDNNLSGDCSGRRFECHYCCRNFPTSQALGGHQNAHKRERQQAKRAHLQSATAHNSTCGDAHVYGTLMNYPLTTLPTISSNNNNNNTNSTSRYYGSQFGSFLNRHRQPHHFHQQPINGNPLALWRIPTASPYSTTTSTTSFNHDRSMRHTPVFYDGEMMKPSYGVHKVGAASGSINGGSGGSSSQGNRYSYESSKPNLQDHLSLDLHL